MKSDLIIVGKILNTHGIKGVLKIMPITSDIKRFSKTDYLIIEDKEYSIESIFYKDKFVFIKFKEFDNINDVLKFKNQFVYIKEEDRVKLKKDTYFISDLIGLNVYDTEKNKLGKIINIIENPANDLYEIEDAKGETHLVPSVKEFVKEIDLKSGIIIKPIRGMFEWNFQYLPYFLNL